MALSFWTSPNNPGTGSGLVERLTITNAGKILAATGGGWVGTVAESATSSVIERGSNANGEFVKYADGTMICQMFEEDFDFNTTGATDFTHPVTFVNRFPVRFASIVDSSTSSLAPNEGIALLGLSGINSSTRVTVTTAKNDTRDIGITVIGRWY
jgi:hypothetical protein